ncbi:MAG: imidazole glycerol phosphate synthase subunit HisH [Candidatus Dormiibacterota bacterium]
MIGVVDYGAGNLASVTNALDFLEVPWQHASSTPQLLAADAVVFPGVGAAGPAMAGLRASGLDQGLLEFLRSGRPYLGICLGLQLLFQRSSEDDSPCLGFLGGEVERLATSQKVPHVGWNTVAVVRPSPLLTGLDGAYFYFTHSYVVRPTSQDVVEAETDHGGTFVSAIGCERVFGVQFHPERSGRDGLRLLNQFCLLAPVTSDSHAG